MSRIAPRIYEPVRPTKRRGRTDAQAERILARQDGVSPHGEVLGETFELDHPLMLWLGAPDNDQNLVALTVEEHKRKTASDATIRAKIKRLIDKHFGVAKTSRLHSRGLSKHPTRKRTFTGTVVKRGEG